jgi:prepilin-type N-terminal cleavage/methylation domain-containing protein
MSIRYIASMYHQVQLMAKRGLSERGFSLIEFLITITITAILLTIMGKFLADFHASREVSSVMMELQEQAQYAIDYMTYGYVVPGNTSRSGGIIWASQYTIDSSRKKISFQGPGTTSPLIFFEERGNRLRKYTNPSDPNDIIPYLEGSQEYLHGPFKVSVNFDNPGGGKSVLIEVTVSKDGLSSTLRSSVTPRNL